MLMSYLLIFFLNKEFDYRVHNSQQLDPLPRQINLMHILKHISLRFINIVFPSMTWTLKRYFHFRDIRNKIVYEFFFCHVFYIPARLIVFGLITVIIFGKWYKSCNSLLRSSLLCFATSCLLCPTILITLLSNNPNA